MFIQQINIHASMMSDAYEINPQPAITTLKLNENRFFNSSKRSISLEVKHCIQLLHNNTIQPKSICCEATDCGSNCYNSHLLQSINHNLKILFFFLPTNSKKYPHLLDLENKEDKLQFCKLYQYFIDLTSCSKITEQSKPLQEFIKFHLKHFPLLFKNHKDIDCIKIILIYKDNKFLKEIKSKRNDHDNCNYSILIYSKYIEDLLTKDIQNLSDDEMQSIISLIRMDKHYKIINYRKYIRNLLHIFIIFLNNTVNNNIKLENEIYHTFLNPLIEYFCQPDLFNDIKKEYNNIECKFHSIQDIIAYKIIQQFEQILGIQLHNYNINMTNIITIISTVVDSKMQQSPLKEEYNFLNSRRTIRVYTTQIQTSDNLDELSIQTQISDNLDGLSTQTQYSEKEQIQTQYSEEKQIPLHYALSSQLIKRQPNINSESLD